MKQFDYACKDRSGLTVRGSMWAESETEVQIKLKQEGMLILSIGEIKKKQKNGAWSLKAVVEFSYQMNLLMEAGIAIRRIMTMLVERRGGQVLYERMREGLQRGLSLSVVLRDTGFPPIGLALVEAGEAAGSLSASFALIQSYYEKERKWRQQIISALSYPAFLFIMLLAFFAVAMGFIIPSFKKVFATMNVPLPLITRIVFSFGDFMKAQGMTVLAVLAILVLLAIVAAKQERLRLSLSHYLWNFGQKHLWIHCFYYTRMMRVWALLLDSGISIIDVLAMTTDLWGNRYAKLAQEAAISKLRNGESLSAVLGDLGLVTDFVSELITIGEETGELVAMTTHCAQYYERTMERYMGRMEKMLEPIMIMGMGMGIGVLVVSVMLPMFQSISSISAM